MLHRTNIRGLILTHLDELEAYGGLPSARVNPGAQGGRPSTAFYLNRHQALLICILSRTERAREVRAEVIRRPRDPRAEWGPLVDRYPQLA